MVLMKMEQYYPPTLTVIDAETLNVLCNSTLSNSGTEDFVFNPEMDW